MRVIVFVLNCLGFMTVIGPAFADECKAPCAGYEISTELQNDWIFAADPSFLKSDVLQPTVTANFVLAPVDFLKLAASIITEPVVDPAPGESAVFDGIGTYAAEVYAVIDVEPATIRAGKFDTIFSLASEAAPGINATELVSDFDADERWGVEAMVNFDALDFRNSVAACCPV